jgi:hypothetical protein
MKKFLISVIMLLTAAISFGQTSRSCDTVSLKTEEDIRSAEVCVMIAADYVLSKPLHNNEQLYFDYRKFILAWMDKSPDYTFSLNQKMVDMCSGDDNVLLFGVYTTCMAKAALQFKKDYDGEAIKIFANYVSNPANGVTQTSKIKKLIEDCNNNQTDKYTK